MEPRPLKLVLIIQARMNSSRLPGKILMKAAGRTLLEHLIVRMRSAAGIDACWVATTDRPEDDVVVRQVQDLGGEVYRGSETDVLARYRGCAEAAGADAVMRMTADCPLADPAVTAQVAKVYRELPNAFDYVSNTLKRTYPRGLDCEVFSRAALESAFREAAAPREREHVTPFLYEHPKRFRLRSVECPVDHSTERWTVDTPEDWELVRRILEAFAPAGFAFGMRDVLDLLDRNPGWRDLNRHIEQKKN